MKSILGFAAFAAASLTSFNCVGGELVILQPTGEESVWLMSKRKMDYLSLPLAERVKKFADAGERGILAAEPNAPTPVLVSWRWWDGFSGMSTVQPVFEVALRRCFSDGSSAPVDFACARETYTFFDNLEIGTTYEVEVAAIAGGRRLATATRKFTTDATAPRLINVPGIPNVRDLGGRVGLDGKRMRQGLIYRTAGLNDNPEEIDFLTWTQCRAEFDAGTLTNRPCWQAGHMANIYRGLHPSNDWHRVPIDWDRGRERLTDEARKIMLDKLGIRTDLDLRGAGEVAGMTVSPLGDRVKWVNVAMTAYGGLAKPRGKELVKQCFDVFLQPENYPIAFHCIGGQDRTGTLAFLIEALMGVDDDELNKDWECSGFTNAGNWFRHETLFNQIYDVINKYPGANTREKVEAYLKDCGLTDSDIAMLRAIILE